MLNNQLPEKAVTSGSTQLLDIQSIFYTIQGEGPFAGHPAVFIRLAGCNLQCPGCDTDYTSQRIKLSAFQIMCAVLDINRAAKLVVITGGEPFRQDLTDLVRQLCEEFTVQIETNGTLPHPEELELLISLDININHKCFIVCSPKTGKVNKLLEPFIYAYKYVLAAGEVMWDGLPKRALEHPASPFLWRPSPNFKGPVYIQPADEQDERLNKINQTFAVNAALRHGYILQLQIHKIIGVE